MNYIELINQFWQIRRSKRITSLQADVYFTLLNECNLRGWENPFEVSNKLICATIGISEPSLIDSRNRLQQIGLIEFQNGKRNSQSPVYYLNILSRNRTVTLVEPLVTSLDETEEKAEPFIKLNETKQNKRRPPLSPVGDPEFPASKIIDLYNQICKNLPAVKILTEKRRKAINARMREHGNEKVIQMLENASKSNFLAGQSQRGFIADLDWLFKPENFAKTLEGKYDDRNKPGYQGATTTNGKDSNVEYLEGAYERLTQQP
jgi:hypothetical protein